MLFISPSENVIPDCSRGCDKLVKIKLCRKTVYSALCICEIVYNCQSLFSIVKVWVTQDYIINVFCPNNKCSLFSGTLSSRIPSVFSVLGDIFPLYFLGFAESNALLNV